MSNKIKITGGAFLFIIIFSVIIFLARSKSDAPTHLSVESIASNEVKISWIGNGKSTQYNIYRSESEKEGFVRVDFSPTEEYVDKGVFPNKEYFYVITQVVNFKESSFSSVLKVRTDTGVPQNINIRSVSFHKELVPGIDLWWDYSIEVDYYNVYRAVEKDGVYIKIATTVNENYSDRDIETGKNYYYRVTQVSDEQEGDFSEKVMATTDAAWSCGERIAYGDRLYKTIKIGDQCWFQENLNVTSSEEIGRSCNFTRLCYNEDGSLCEKFGGIYTFESTACGEKHEGMQGLCPLGWRVPSDEDWAILETEVGMDETQSLEYGFRGINEGSILSGERSLWKDGYLSRNPNFGTAQFVVLPGGVQVSFGSKIFRDMGESVVFWTSTNATKDEKCRVLRGEGYNTRQFNYNNEGIQRECQPDTGAAYLRCVRDYR